jgi:hypothetical protein
MQTFSQIIDAFGGAASFGAAVGIPDSHARAMKARNSIPDGYWLKAVNAAQDRGIDGVTLESLAAISASRMERSAQ